MISQQLPRITLGATINFEQMAQCMAFTYLSKYSGEAMQPRVLTAFERAWAPDDIQMLAPGTDNNPGACLAFWNGDGLRHCLVAMPGATDLPSLWSMFSGIGYHTVDGCQGSVFSAFRSRAYTMWDRLFANATFAAAVANPRCVFTFTGHSLGGAMAEIMSFRFKAANPTKNVRCIKFGSPRLGTERWFGNTDKVIQFASVYNGRDPIHAFPQVFSSLNPIFLPTEALLLRNFERDQSPWRYTYEQHAQWANTFENMPITGTFEYAANYLQGSGFGSRWYDHNMGAYRTAFANYCGSRPDLLKYRFNYLEFNDENMYGILFTPGLREWEDIHWLNVTQPDPIQPLTGEVARVANAPVVVQQVAPIQPDRVDPVAAENPPFGGVPPVSTAYRPRRIVRQAPVNP